MRVTRLAPSPTGALHLGNARTFLINWALARRQGWRTVMRVEDLDTPRVKPDAQRQAVEDLAWLGINCDEGPYFQAENLAPYHAAIAELQRQGRVYACRCTRSEIAAAQSAPNQGDHELRYPGTCRSLGLQNDSAEPTALRVIIPDEVIRFDDMIAGPQSFNVQQQVGDFLIATKVNLPAYQLAVVVDDARQQVTDIVRGDDLLSSAARQLWLYRFLNLTPLPRYWHVPLVLGEDGRRLAKRHGDTRLAWYRGQGVAVERIIGLVARWCGMTDRLAPLSPAEFVAGFDVAKLPPEPVIFTASDHAWLLET